MSKIIFKALLVAIWAVCAPLWAEDLAQNGVDTNTNQQNMNSQNSANLNANQQNSADSSANQQSTSEFIEALRGGEKSGDINLLFSLNRTSPTMGAQNGGIFQNSAYLATSFGLYYKSAFYGYFRLNLGFRGALPLWEQSRKTAFSDGSGSAARDFWDNNIAMVARSYLEYFDGDTSIKAGRIEDKTDMIDRHIDGVWISNKSLGWLLIDVIYMNQVGRVLDRELSGFEKFVRYDNANGAVSARGNSKYGGAYYLGLGFEIFDWLKLKAYGLTSPQIYSFVAGKFDINTMYFLINGGFVGGFEHRYGRIRAENDGRWSYLAHADMGGKYDSQYGLFYATLGYRGTQSEAGMGSLNLTGNTFNPFFYFSGNALENAKALHLVYGKIGFKVDFLDIFVLYGYNFFKGDISRNGNAKNGQGEVNFYMDWRFSDFTSVIVHFLNTHGSKSAIPNNTRFDFMFKVSL